MRQKIYRAVYLHRRAQKLTRCQKVTAEWLSTKEKNAASTKMKMGKFLLYPCAVRILDVSWNGIPMQKAGTAHAMDRGLTIRAKGPHPPADAVPHDPQFLTLFQHGKPHLQPFLPFFGYGVIIELGEIQMGRKSDHAKGAGFLTVFRRLPDVLPIVLCRGAVPTERACNINKFHAYTPAYRKLCLRYCTNK